MELASPSGMPRRSESFVNSHAPVMNPIAMPRPCGEIAIESPTRKRSRTGQPTDARVSNIAGESIGGLAERGDRC
jgi:hypothetical protein